MRNPRLTQKQVQTIIVTVQSTAKNNKEITQMTLTPEHTLVFERSY